LLWTGTEGGQPETLGLFTRKSSWYILNSIELSNAGYVQSSKDFTYFVCDLVQVFAIETDSIQIKVDKSSEFGTPQISNWKNVFVVKNLEVSK
jgi:hypothetical protein